MKPNPYIKFWAELNDAIAHSGSTLSSIARMTEAECDPESNNTFRKLTRWRSRVVPPDSIGFLIAVLEVIDCELVIRKKDKGVR